METISDRADKWSGRLSNLYTLWPLLPAGGIAVVSAWLSTTVAWINQWGAFGWWTVGLVSFILSAGGLYLVAKVRERFAFAAATKRWARESDQVNPLDSEFVKKRINIQHLAHPFSSWVKNKHFSACQLVGPANIMFVGNGLLDRCQFSHCDVVILRDDKEVPLHNAFAFSDCTLLQCELVRCTLYVTKRTFEQSFEGDGVEPITFAAAQH